MKLDVSTRYRLELRLNFPVVSINSVAAIHERPPRSDSHGARPGHPEKRVDTLISFCYSPCSPFLWESCPNPRWLQNAHLQRPSSAFEKESTTALARLNTT
jgi:hypothetical protein